jgi:hypothetical protein
VGSRSLLPISAPEGRQRPPHAVCCPIRGCEFERRVRSHGSRRGLVSAAAPRLPRSSHLKLAPMGAPLGPDSGPRRPGQQESSPDHGRIRTAGSTGDRASIGEGWREAGLPLGHSFEVIWSARLGEFAWGRSHPGRQRRPIIRSTRTLRIRQTHGLDCSTAMTISPLSTAANITQYVFHELSRAEGPRRQTPKTWSLRQRVCGKEAGALAARGAHTS